LAVLGLVGSRTCSQQRWSRSVRAASTSSAPAWDGETQRRVAPPGFALMDAYANDPDDFLGRWVLTLTAHSDVLRRYDGGDGRVALHGRGGESLRDPLGSAASHGCIRISNAAIASIVRRIGVAAIPGTPVMIAA
jgi:hypothetical protein